MGSRSVSDLDAIVAIGSIENAIRLRSNLSSGLQSEREINLFSQLKINLLHK